MNHFAQISLGEIFTPKKVNVKGEFQMKQDIVNEIFDMAVAQGCKLKIGTFYGILSPFLQKDMEVRHLEDIRKECLEKRTKGQSIVAYIKITRANDKNRV